MGSLIEPEKSNAELVVVSSSLTTAGRRQGTGKGRTGEDQAGEGERDREAFLLAGGHILVALDRSRTEAHSVARS